MMPIRVRLPRYSIPGQGICMCQHAAPIDGDSIPLDLLCIDLLPLKSLTRPTLPPPQSRLNAPGYRSVVNGRTSGSFWDGGAEKVLSG